MDYTYFSQTSPSLPPEGVEVEVVILRTTVAFVGAVLT